MLLAAAAMLLVLISCISGPWAPKKPTRPMSDKIQRCDPMKSDLQMIKVPVFRQTWQIVEDCNKYPTEAVAIAMVFFYKDWVMHFGDSRGEIWASLKRSLCRLSVAARSRGHRHLPQLLSSRGLQPLKVRHSCKLFPACRAEKGGLQPLKARHSCKQFPATCSTHTLPSHARRPPME